MIIPEPERPRRELALPTIHDGSDKASQSFQDVRALGWLGSLERDERDDENDEADTQRYQSRRPNDGGHR
ncbi:hypothetical protein Ppa06_24980 [Planomonospora parontospora subsp. parontospora]|uniref:Uncharacterized protein n=2 Tax=Planomonospora parontospora TaxID=58119 RepID=A0AA37BF28_9ACTN|nr:hypothetical protein GCM10010126_20700 [Planomonospora parontospora]GII08700.1 hypothetical protein Ppa06_24980 [Planomonospora parontospora subsp. parontospora]